MSILIRGREMPDRCESCGFMNPFKDPPTCGLTGTRILGNANARLDNCPLVEIPPHGDLIDRDALTERLDEIWDCNDMVFEDDKICGRIHADCKSCRWRETRDYITDKVIKHAPTIIEAEEDE